MMVKGFTPITRAACTYSLLRSTSVAPRTVRAYCTQSDSAMDTISTHTARSLRMSGGTRPRTMPNTSNAIRIDGKVSCTSAMRMMIVGPAAAIAGKKAQHDADHHGQSITADTPTNSEMREP
jgi:hypothetical protein